MESATDSVIPWVFWRVKGPGVRKDGQQTRAFYKAWQSACVKAGLGHEIRDEKGRLVKRVAHRLRHDFRRTAVTNLEMAGVPRSTAMEMVGHKTESIYRRYSIPKAAALRLGAEKLAALHAAQKAEPGPAKITAIANKRG